MGNWASLLLNGSGHSSSRRASEEQAGRDRASSVSQGHRKGEDQEEVCGQVLASRKASEFRN